MCNTFLVDKNIKISDDISSLAPFKAIPKNFNNLLNSTINRDYPTEQLSTNEEDYIFIATPIFSYNTPNCNGIAYPGKDESFSSLKTAIGKPVIFNHNLNDAIILGIVIDVFTDDKEAYTLLALDATKLNAKDYIEYVINANKVEFSISSYSTNFVCSECGIPIDKKIENGRLVPICCKHLTNKVKFDPEGYIYCTNYNTGAHILKKDFTTIEVSLVSIGAEACSHTSNGYSIL